MKSMLKNIFILLVLWLIPTAVFSANIFFESSKQAFALGQEFSVQIFLNTEKDSINAVEGEAVFPVKLLEVVEIQDGNSAINFWIEKPHSVSPGKVKFSGIIPGGGTGPQSFLFTVIFRAKTEGEGKIEFQNVQVLKNDGVGTAASIKVSPLSFVISNKISDEDPTKTSPQAVDTDAPEKFKPEIVRDSEIFDGKYFLVFATQDKGSGIDHYEVREGFFGAFATATSPYILNNQEKDQRISVRAVDKKGNVRTGDIFPLGIKYWGSRVLIFTLLSIGVLYIRRALKK